MAETSVPQPFPLLQRAPIVEAVLDFRAPFKKNWEASNLKGLLLERLVGYPVVEEQRIIAAGFAQQVGNPPQMNLADLGCHGLLFRSQDGLKVAQFRRDGFTFSRLAPYERWETFAEEAQKQWLIYVELGQPEVIQRLAVRFINRLLLPADGFKLNEYLQQPPKPPLGLEWPFHGFFHQSTFAVPATDLAVTLVLTNENPVGSPPQIPLLLDIDVFVKSPILPTEDLTARLQEMRLNKNLAFFRSLSDKAISLLR